MSIRIRYTALPCSAVSYQFDGLTNLTNWTEPGHLLAGTEVSRQTVVGHILVQPHPTLLCMRLGRVLFAERILGVGRKMSEASSHIGRLDVGRQEALHAVDGLRVEKVQQPLTQPGLQLCLLSAGFLVVLH